MDDPLEDIFRERLQHHEETPSENSWPNIKERIAPKTGIRSQRSMRLLSVLMLLLAVSVLLLQKLPVLQSGNGFAGLPELAKQEEFTSANSTQMAHQPSADGMELSVTNAIPENSAGKTSVDVASDQNLANSKFKPDVNQPQINEPLNAKAEAQNRPEIKSATLSKSANAATAKAEKNRKVQSAKSATGLALNTRQTTRNTKQIRGQDLPRKTQLNTHQGTKGVNSTDGQLISDAAGSGKIPAKESDKTSPQTGSSNAKTAATEREPINVSETTTAKADTVADSALSVAKTMADSVAQASAPELASDPEKEAFNRKLRFGFYTGTRYGIRKFAPNTTDQVYISDVSEQSKTDPNRFQYEAGLAVQKSLNKKLAAEIGLGMIYSREQAAYTATTGQTEALAIANFGTQLHVEPAYKYDRYRTDSKALYSNLRAGLVYTLIDHSAARIQVAGGATAGMLTWQNTQLFVNNEKSGEAASLSKLQTSAYAGIRFGRTVSDKLDMAIEPSVNYNFNPRYREPVPFSIKNHTYNLNLLLFLR